MHTKDELHAYTIVFGLKNGHYYFKKGKFIDSDAAKKLGVSLLDDAWIDCKGHNELPAMIRSKDVYATSQIIYNLANKRGVLDKLDSAKAKKATEKEGK